MTASYVTLSTDPEARQAFVAGLRALARFVASHPDVPVPAYGTAIKLHTFGTDDQDRHDVDTFAAALSVTAAESGGGGHHYIASRAFGPVSYEAIAIPAATMAVHEAETSYRGCVHPDDAADLGEVA